VEKMTHKMCEGQIRKITQYKLKKGSVLEMVGVDPASFGFGLQAIGDLFVWVPNTLGLILGLAQVALCLVFPAVDKRAGALKKVRSQSSGEENEGLV
jgi:hypothetical protein